MIQSQVPSSHVGRGDGEEVLPSRAQLLLKTSQGDSACCFDLGNQLVGDGNGFVPILHCPALCEKMGCGSASLIHRKEEGLVWKKGWTKPGLV